jgi:hypothetical protein
MCGPLALALPAAGDTTPPYVLGRVAYNAGRIITYCLLGIVFGLAGYTFLMAGLQRWVSIALGAALLFGLLTSQRLALSRPVTSAVNQLKSSMSVLLRRPSLTGLATLGLLNGLLPCGLVYVACAGAAAAGSTLAGALYMTAFGVGTVPMMLAISLSGKLVPTSLRLKLVKTIPVFVFLLGTLLILRGMSLGIPYLSPDMSGSGAACCSK